MIVRSGTKDQPKERQVEQSKKVVRIVNQNQDKIREAAKTGNWTLLIRILTKESEKQGVDVDWKKIFDGHDDNQNTWRAVIKKWSETKPKDSKHMDIHEWVQVIITIAQKGMK